VTRPPPIENARLAGRALVSVADEANEPTENTSSAVNSQGMPPPILARHWFRPDELRRAA
jgi:hypothetical protein